MAKVIQKIVRNKALNKEYTSYIVHLPKNLVEALNLENAILKIKAEGRTLILTPLEEAP